MSSMIERARKLIVLAADPQAGEEQARTSAVIACKLIVKHGFVLVEGPAPKGARPNVWDARVDPNTPPPWARPPAGATPSPTSPNPPPGYAPRRAARRRHAGGVSVPLGRTAIRAVHFGQCPLCGTGWKPGDLIAYKRGLRMTCLGCRERP